MQCYLFILVPTEHGVQQRGAVKMLQIWFTLIIIEVNDLHLSLACSSSVLYGHHATESSSTSPFQIGP